MKKQFIACGFLVALITAGSLSVSAETVTRTLSHGSGYTGYSPLGGQNYNHQMPPPQHGSNIQPERPPLYKEMGNRPGNVPPPPQYSNNMQPPPCDYTKTNCAPPPVNNREFGGYSYNSNERPAPPSFSGDRPDMPPNMSQQFQRPYQTRYNHNN